MKSDLLDVEHILACIRRVEEYTGGQRDWAGREAFRSSSLGQHAVLRNLQVLAETAGPIIAEDFQTLKEKAGQLRKHLVSPD